MPRGVSPHIHTSRSASIDTAGLQGSQRPIQQVRPSTARASTDPPWAVLPLIGVGSNLGQDPDVWASLQTASAGAMDMPTILVQRSPTPDSFYAASLPRSFVYPVTRTPARSLDVAPSEDSGHSISSGPPTPSGPNEASSSEIIVLYEPDGAVKAATLHGLVKRLLLDSRDFSKDLEFRQIFLSSYRAFSNAEVVFSLLREQFEAVSSPEHTGEQRASVRYSVLTVLELWVRENHVEAKDVNLLDQMREFVTDLQATSHVPPFREAAQRIADLTVEKTLAFRSPVPPLTPSSSSPSSRWSFNPSDITPEHLALALTLIERDRYLKIISPDCVAWLQGLDGSNGVSSFIAENKKLSYWAEKSVLRIDDQERRSQNLVYFICVIEECRRLRNFSSACALIVGLAGSSITNLKRTFDLDASSMHKFLEAQKLISYEKNFKAYRTALNSTPNEPCIPWLYVHLHDLKIIHRAYPPVIDQDDHKGLINFYRHRRVHQRIRHILSYQDPPLEPANVSHHHAELQMFMQDQLRSLVSDDALRDWLHERGSTLAAEERLNYDRRTRELALAGFIKPASVAPQRPRVPRPSTANSRHTAVSHTTEAEMPLPPRAESPTPEADDPLGDPFDKNSEHCLDGRINLHGLFAVACGGFADVWEGLMDTQKVAIKTIRPFSGSGKRFDNSRLLRRLRREYEAWISVSHPNVLECLGFSYDFSREPHILPSLISPWMSNGTVFPYFEKFPDADRMKLLLGIARGLAYLHDQKIIHGDLRAGNVLISNSGVPCLSDFGLSRLLQVEVMTTTSDLAGSLRWMSPELLTASDQIIITPDSDVWAFGMTVLEIMSGRHPYYELRSDFLVLSQLRDGELPVRPRDIALLTNKVWAICQQCWIIEPQYRDPMNAVSNKLAALTN